MGAVGAQSANTESQSQAQPRRWGGDAKPLLSSSHLALQQFPPRPRYPRAGPCRGATCHALGHVSAVSLTCQEGTGAAVQGCQGCSSSLRRGLWRSGRGGRGGDGWEQCRKWSGEFHIAPALDNTYGTARADPDYKHLKNSMSSCAPTPQNRKEVAPDILPVLS